MNKQQEKIEQVENEKIKLMEDCVHQSRFYIHCADDINKQLLDTESDFNIHIEEVGSDEELIRLCNRLNKQQAIIVAGPPQLPFLFINSVVVPSSGSLSTSKVMS